MATKVKNLNGTSDNDCPKCGTWLKHWEKLSGKKAGYCGRCTKKATLQILTTHCLQVLLRLFFL